MNKPELLAPAGSFDKAKIAFKYGADAVYCGTAKLSLRARVDVDDNDLAKTIEYAHSIGKKVYAAVNIYAADSEYEEIINQIKALNEIKVDGIIVSDGGILDIIKEYAPDVEIHMSTQTNVTSLHTSNFWHKNGADRIILGRELTKYQLKEIMDNKLDDLKIEMFIHGALCVSYSGRCLLSDFLANRSANHGDCAQCCRWQYNIYLEDNNKPGEFMPVKEDEKGTYILSSKDLCLIKEIPEICEMGLESLKIEGRLKTEYYVATVVNAYRCAIDDYIKNPKEYDYTKYLNELEKTKTRRLCTYFYYGKEAKDIQDYDNKQYNANYEYAGIVIETKNDLTVVEIKNKLQVGDKLEIIMPKKIESYAFEITELFDYETGDSISVVNPGVAEQKVRLKIPIDVEQGTIMRRKK